MPLQLLAVGVK